MNDPVSHDLAWLDVPNKLPSNIPKFEGKAGEDPSEHVTTFHLWCSSNSLHDNSIHLRLFQRTLTGPTTKLYIDLPRGAYVLFDDLAMTFLNHYFPQSLSATRMLQHWYQTLFDISRRQIHTYLGSYSRVAWTKPVE